MKNLMAVGKSLILTATFVSLIGCTSHSVNQSASVKNSVTGPYGAALSSADIGWRLYQDDLALHSALRNREANLQ